MTPSGLVHAQVLVDDTPERLESIAPQTIRVAHHRQRTLVLELWARSAAQEGDNT